MKRILEIIMLIFRGRPLLLTPTDKVVIPEQDKLYTAFTVKSTLFPSPDRVLAIPDQNLPATRVAIKAKLLNSMIVLLDQNGLIEYGELDARIMVLKPTENSEKDFDKIFKIQLEGYTNDFGLGPMRTQINISDNWLEGKDIKHESINASKANTSNR